MKIHEKYMLRCIEIARNALGSAAPNPAVGAVIVKDEKIIGEGTTSAYGGPHAEVRAIRSVTDTSLLKDATLYVTLEPCAHFGKTPPCADLIVKNGIPRVVVGIMDPHDKVAGKGIQKLKDGGCDVRSGVLENECREHHKRFLTFHEKKRPYIILKWAETADGYLAPEKELRKKNPEPFWISNVYSRQLVHKWRAEEQAILVGTQTVLQDNPKLDVRSWKGVNPYRVILDRSLKITGAYHVLDRTSPSLILTEVQDKSKYHQEVEYRTMDFSKDVAQQIATILWERNFTSVLIEGGAKTLQTFIHEGFWDEARVTVGNTSFSKGTPAPEISKTHYHSKKIERDTLNTYYND